MHTHFNITVWVHFLINLLVPQTGSNYCSHTPRPDLWCFFSLFAHCRVAAPALFWSGCFCVSASLRCHGCQGTIVRGVRPIESVTFVLLRDAKGPVSSGAEECRFLRREGEVMRFRSSPNRGTACLLTSQLWPVLTNEKLNCLFFLF